MGSFPSTGLRRAAWCHTGRHGGFSSAPWNSLNLAEHVGDDPADVQRNRDAVRRALGVQHVQWMQAEHGAQVRSVGPNTPPGVGDVLITTSPGIGLGALAADCVPMALFAPEGILAVVHCGWRGLMVGAVPTALDALEARGASRVDAVVGAAICGACYPVPAERVRQVREHVSAAVAQAALSEAANTIDVRAGVLQQLREHRLPDSVQVIGGCTAEDPDLYSYRRDGLTGRHGIVAAMEPGPDD